jgi:hypothetical protein
MTELIAMHKKVIKISVQNCSRAELRHTLL